MVKPIVLMNQWVDCNGELILLDLETVHVVVVDTDDKEPSITFRAFVHNTSFPVYMAVTTATPPNHTEQQVMAPYWRIPAGADITPYLALRVVE